MKVCVVILEGLWILSRALIIDGDDYTITILFSDSALFPLAVVDHYIAHINRIYIFLQNWGEGGDGRVKYIPGDIKQESEKEAKETGLRRMFVDILGVEKDCSELWGGCDGHDTSGALDTFVEHFMHVLKCFTCINPFTELINILVN